MSWSGLLAHLQWPERPPPPPLPSPSAPSALLAAPAPPPLPRLIVLQDALSTPCDFVLVAFVWSAVRSGGRVAVVLTQRSTRHCHLIAHKAVARAHTHGTHNGHTSGWWRWRWPWRLTSGWSACLCVCVPVCLCPSASSVLCRAGRCCRTSRAVRCCGWISLLPSLLPPQLRGCQPQPMMRGWERRRRSEQLSHLLHLHPHSTSLTFCSGSSA